MLIRDGLLKWVQWFFFTPLGRAVSSVIHGPISGLAKLSAAAIERGREMTKEERSLMYREGNLETSQLRENFPVEPLAPEAVVILCVDPRLDPIEVLGCRRPSATLFVRSAGSGLSERDVETIWMAIKKGKCNHLLLTTHSDCKAEGIACSTESAKFPSLTGAVSDREGDLWALLGTHIVYSAVVEGRLMVERAHIKTELGCVFGSYQRLIAPGNDIADWHFVELLD